MAESAEQVHARVVAAVGLGGHLPVPAALRDWEHFPWEVVDGVVAARALPQPSDETPRYGESADRPCGMCAEGMPAERVVWEDEFWILSHEGGPSGLPIVLVLQPREHLDFGQLPDDRASEFGRISNRVVRIIEGVDNIGRAHLHRWGDGGSHMHAVFVGRTARLAPVLGSPTIDWDELLPPGPEDVWRADLHQIASKLANWGGDARV
jgi:diadenosine tetraphosphate (Ap4A) HIT family hydrolase